MKRIQYISTNEKYLGFEYHHISEPDAFDKYDINIVDLNSSDCWYHDGFKFKHGKRMNYIGELYSTSSNNKTLVILPQNYFYNGSGKISDILEAIKKVIYLFIDIPIKIKLENNETILDGNIFETSFYFVVNDTMEKIIKSEKTNRTLAFRYGDCAITTLDIKTKQQLNILLKEIGFLGEEESLPEWLEDYSVFNEETLKNKNSINENTIKQLQKEIEENNKTINEYRRYKTLLSETGDVLVELVKDVLKEITGIDCSTFVDDKKEDLRFEFNNNIYLFEIKGTNKGVLRSNITQISSRRDEYVETNNDVPIKPILIINDQRLTPISERISPNEELIHLAEMYDELIIQTHTLLKCLELFRKKEISCEDFLNILEKQNGLLTI